jgi:hypothetical protein
MPLQSVVRGCITHSNTTGNANGCEEGVHVVGIDFAAIGGIAGQTETTGAISVPAIGGETSRKIHGVNSLVGTSIGGNKGVRYMYVSIETPPNVAIEAGWINRTGQKVNVGDYVYAVES